MKKILYIAAVLCILGILTSCRNEPAPEKKKIEKITFIEDSRTMYIGETISIGISAEPPEGKRNDKVIYRSSEPEIVEIKEESGNDGVVITAIKRGAAIITASANGVVDYCQITVLGGSESIPFITVPYQVIETRKGERNSIIAALSGGTEADKKHFLWSCTNQNVITLETAGNTAVFDSTEIGQSVITVSHPRAQFSADILVYVLGTDEKAVYITTNYNVIPLNKDQSAQFEVYLHGGEESDNYQFNFSIAEGRNIIDIKSNNNLAELIAKEAGIAKIEVSHPKAGHTLQVLAVVQEEREYRYIELDKTFIITDEGSHEILSAYMIGDVPNNYTEKYSFRTEDETVINVINNNGQFIINALKKGTSTITIKNDYADFSREALVIVNGPGEIYDEEIYISTSQNVISTEVGGNDIILSMMLVGGNEADKNNFTWTVDDGSVIELTSAHGNVSYIGRSIIGNSNDKFEAQALIKAKKVGIAAITLENPKAKNSCTVIVKVYRKGVFDILPAVIEGSKVYKLEPGERLPVNLYISTGNNSSINIIKWETEHPSIATTVNTGLNGFIEGKSQGITTLIVSGDNVHHNYNALIIVGNEDYRESAPYMYAYNPFVSVIKGESIEFGVICCNMSYEEIGKIKVSNNSAGIMEMTAYRNMVVLSGLEPGEGEIVFSADGVNTVTVTVMVEDYDINPETPFYLKSEKAIYGIVRGSSVSINVDLAGANETSARNIVWSIEDINVAMLSENNRQCMVTARSVGQTVIRVSHPRSKNNLEIVIYVVEKEEELNEKIIIYVKDRNIMMQPGELKFISVITNANEAQRSGFRWDVSDINVVKANVSGDMVKAHIEAAGIGSTTITIRHNNNVMPAVICVSVISGQYQGSYISVPSIIETVTGRTIAINAAVHNIKDTENIEWEILDTQIGEINAHKEQCYLTALKEGKTIITVKHNGLGYRKNIIVYVYAGYNEIADKYILAGEQSRYVIYKGDIINVGLVFGLKGFPEHEVHNIRWAAENNNVAAVIGNGKTAQIRGLNEGIGIITISSGIADPAEIEIEVRREATWENINNNYPGIETCWFYIAASDKLRGIAAGDYADIGIRLFSGNNELSSHDDITWETENTAIVNVEKTPTGIRVWAQSLTGQSYITLKHPLAQNTRILVYTAATESALENMYPLFIEKNQYVISRGEKINIEVMTRDNMQSRLNSISYRLDKNNGITAINERSKREITAEGIALGSDDIIISYGGTERERIRIMVREGSGSGNSDALYWFHIEEQDRIKGIITGSYTDITIKLFKGEEEVYSASGIEYLVENPGIISVSASGSTVRIQAGILAGKSYITVMHPLANNARILIYTAANEQELAEVYPVYIEKTNYVIRKGDSEVITVQTKDNKPENLHLLEYELEANDGIIGLNELTKKEIKITGFNTGNDSIIIRYNGNIVQKIYVIVIDNENEPHGNGNTADYWFYIEPDNRVIGILTGGYARIKVKLLKGENEVYAYNEINFITENTDIINVEKNGNEINIRASDIAGQSFIIVQHPFARDARILVYTAATARELENYYPVFTEKDTYTIKRKETIKITIFTNDNDSEKLRNISYETGNNETSIGISERTKTELMVTGISAGNAEVVIKYNGVIVQKIYIQVLEDETINNNGGNNTGKDQYWLYACASDRIKGLLTGETAEIAISLFNGTAAVDFGNNLRIETEHEDIIKAERNPAGITVKAQNTEGKSYITVSYPMAEDLKILVYVSQTQAGLDNEYPVYFNKINYLIQKGETITITAETKDNDSTKLGNIVYSLEKGNGVISINEKSKKELMLSAEKTGSETIIVRYNGTVVNRVYVSVTEGNYGFNGTYLLTESIIGIVRGNEYKTSIAGNTAGNILWLTENENIAAVVSKGDKSAIIQGINTGHTTITVRAGDAERHIVVIVCTTADELRNYSAVNVPQRYYRIRKNENISIDIKKLNISDESPIKIYNYYTGEDLSNKLSGNSPINTGIINILRPDNLNNTLHIKGINEGIGALRIGSSINPDQDFVIYIEVNGAAEGTVSNIESSNFITAGKLLYIIDKNDVNIPVTVGLGTASYTGNNWKWNVDKQNIISIAYEGMYGIINPIEEGQARITVTNYPDCSNELVITVIVGNRFITEEQRIPYIWAEKTIYEVEEYQGYEYIPYSIINTENADYSKVYIEGAIDAAVAEIANDPENRRIAADIRKSGLIRFNIVYENIRKEIYIIVRKPDNHAHAFLTTSENYTVIGRGELKTIHIKMTGYNEINPGNFIWKCSNTGIVQIAGNGESCQIYGVATGDALITVYHKDKTRDYPLNINVKVVNQGALQNVVYLTTNQNVIQTFEKTTGTIYVNKIGGAFDEGKTSWKSSDTAVLSINGQNYSGIYEAKKEGISAVTVSLYDDINTNKIIHELKIFIIVGKDLNNGVYLHTGETLIHLIPGGQQKRISIELINGDPKDYNKLQWSLEQKPAINSIQNAQTQVISMLPSNNECFINPLNEGIAEITIGNRDISNYDLTITVIVAYNENIRFASEKKAIARGDTQFVGLYLPAYENLSGKVRVWSEDPSICTVYENYTKDYVLLYGKDIGTARIKAEIKGTGKEALLLVDVYNDEELNTNRIITSRTMIVSNPDEEPFTLRAFISGEEISDADNDSIEWQVFESDINKKVINIYPQLNEAGSETIDNADYVYRFRRSNEIMITPLNYGTVLLRLRSPLVNEEYAKEICIVVEDVQKIFDVNPKDISISSMEPVYVKADITGAVTRDYSDITWYAEKPQKWDGTLIEIVRIMGSGREIMLYPMGEGTTTLWALYRDQRKAITVSVINEYYFDFQNHNESMFPGQIKRLNYYIRPLLSSITWVGGTEYSMDGNSLPIVSYGEVLGSGSVDGRQAIRQIEVKALREGATSITGMSNGSIGTVNITVAYDYTFHLDQRIRSIMGVPKGGRGSYENTNSTAASNGIQELKYYIYPPDTYIKAEEPLPDGLVIDIIAPDTSLEDTNPNYGWGKIVFTGTREMEKELRFKHYKARTSESDDEIEIEGENNEDSITVTYKYKERIEPIPLFVKGDGYWTYEDNIEKGRFSGNTIKGTNGKYLMEFGDGEEHYIYFDKLYPDAYLEIDSIELISNGEADRNGAIDIQSDKLIDNNVSQFSAAKYNMNIDGRSAVAVRLSGGEDQINYDRIMFEKNLVLQTETPFFYDETSVPKVGGRYLTPSIQKKYLYEMNNPSVSQQYRTIPISKPYSSFNGDYYSIGSSSTGSGGSSIESRTYLLLKNTELHTMNKLTFDNNAQAIHGDDWLYAYWNSSTYSFYIGPSGSVTLYNTIKATLPPGSYTEITVYKPFYYYSAAYYSANESKFPDGTTRYYKSENAQELDFVISWHKYSSGSSAANQTYQMKIYRYDAHVLESFGYASINTAPQAGMQIRVTSQFKEGWYGTQYVIDNQNSSNPDFRNWYDKTCFYSTYAYEGDVGTVIAEGNPLTFSEYIFKNKGAGRYGSRSSGPDFVYNSYNTNNYTANNNYSRTAINFNNNWSNQHGFSLSSLAQEGFDYNNISNSYFYLVGSSVLSSKLGGNVKEKFSFPFGPNIINGSYPMISAKYPDFTMNSRSVNIFGKKSTSDLDDTTVNYNVYSKKYWRDEIYLGFTSYLHALDDHDGYNRREAIMPIWVRQMLKWEPFPSNVSGVTVPNNFFNRWPFRYEATGISDINRGPVQILCIDDSSGCEGKPMPSIDTGIKSVQAIKLKINYKTFNFTGTDNGGSVEIDITYNIRECHMNFRGKNFGKGRINEILSGANNGENTEYEGKIKSFADLPPNYSGSGKNTYHKYMKQ